MRLVKDFTRTSNIFAKYFAMATAGHTVALKIVLLSLSRRRAEWHTGEDGLSKEFIAY